MTETELADREWRLLRDEPRDGATQMALEEVAAERALEHDLRTVRVYSWEPSTLSLGYRQDAASVDWEYCEREGIDVTRRQTGGGGIYHDRYADISYTIVAPADEVPGDLMDCYALFCEPVLEAFDQMGVDADFAAAEQASIYHPSCYLRDINPAHDVVVPAGEADAQKISGNAQYRQRDVVIQHGSISYDLEPDHHVGVFDAGLEPRTVTDRVTSIREQVGIDREEAVETLADALCDWCDAAAGGWHEDELERAADLADRKYGSGAWVRKRETLEGDDART
ncbi:lipoate--protein ligase family protein [Natronobacterium gregoryi]|uniref:Biotin/lipoate A/B protein ligase n=2 Tax=Natronobacterium gregoryi TaxID=44930 RepID=L0AKV4_NATGS|nr:biotin/lipoate A/B protein ligase family protein [Natronobacterium gregoryi]AFZ73660.1 lipoate-protein ligase A [Natronobacterium gregoryi SP2]ELY67854.1 biotin/lipoate A/B protein ligase [Natronobacterium gregoryi SP2]PLK19615.1 lipoate--protein ligase family protein [Natronobacterium gregoryi SP2]SFJ00469.1 lipoate-protein ligase A [Natronobacterium gregoryi]